MSPVGESSAFDLIISLVRRIQLRLILVQSSYHNKSPPVPRVYPLSTTYSRVHPLSTTYPRVHPSSPSSTTQPCSTLPTIHNRGTRPSYSGNECLGAVAATNDKLIASLARISLPKCHPDIFFGDATMFHPWKSTFKGMISDSEITAEQEMNYLHMYTRGAPQKLVNSFR